MQQEGGLCGGDDAFRGPLCRGGAASRKVGEECDVQRGGRSGEGW